MDGELVHFGADPFDGFVDFSSAPTDLVDVAAGERHVCVLRSTGEVLCAGDTLYGQLGNPAATGTTFEMVPGLTSVGAIRARKNATCVVTADEGLCWGENTFGGLGIGTTGNQPTPAPVSLGGLAPTTLEAGFAYGCGLFANVAYCFGHRNGRAVRGLPPEELDTLTPTVPVGCLP